jgi:DNA-binding NtrC family response regulator
MANHNLQPIKQRFGIIGNSPALDNSMHTAVQVSGTDLTVLVTGESGVGKEAFSKIIHGLSPRKHNTFIAVNCGAIPEGTINSELFGHVKGSFTGALGDRKGYFETANGGTIFLDEVGEMPLETQTRLLRVLEQGEFIRVGDSQVHKTDVRVVAATNVDLMDKIRKGKFREDLYYRLSTVPIRVPSLKERREDIHLLFRKFAADFAERYRTPAVRLDVEAQRLLENYPFPGNIRELKNMAEQVSVLADDKEVTGAVLRRIVPSIAQSHLPVLADGEHAGPAPGFQEREIMFKFLYDMKKDLNDLKSLVVELVRTNNLRMPGGLPTAPAPPPILPAYGASIGVEPKGAFPSEDVADPPIFFERQTDAQPRYQEAQEVDEHLSLEDMEKDFILKALRKHRGRRKDAAVELGISERTLYRKIKEFNIKE